MDARGAISHLEGSRDYLKYKLPIVMALSLTAALRTDNDAGCINAQHALFSGNNMAYKYYGHRAPSNCKDARSDLAACRPSILYSRN